VNIFGNEKRFVAKGVLILYFVHLDLRVKPQKFIIKKKHFLTRGLREHLDHHSLTHLGFRVIKESF